MAVIMVCSCSIKEDRTDCPCFLDVVVEEIHAPYNNMLVSVFSSSISPSYREMVSLDEELETIALKRGYVDVNALWGISSSIVRGRSLSIPYGRQMDSIYSSTARSVDATGELAVAMVRGSKQFCTVSLRMKAQAGESGWDRMSLVGEVCGVDLIALTPVSGDFRAVAQPSDCSSGEFTIRIPRQSGGTLLLEFDEFGTVLDIGEYIERSGYDWSAESLEDISVDVDLVHSIISIGVNSWELSWDYSVVI